MSAAASGTTSKTVSGASVSPGNDITKWLGDHCIHLHGSRYMYKHDCPPGRALHAWKDSIFVPLDMHFQLTLFVSQKQVYVDVVRRERQAPAAAVRPTSLQSAKGSGSPGVAQLPQPQPSPAPGAAGPAASVTGLAPSKGPLGIAPSAQPPSANGSAGPDSEGPWAGFNWKTGSDT